MDSLRLNYNHYSVMDITLAEEYFKKEKVFNKNIRLDVKDVCDLYKNKFVFKYLSTDANTCKTIDDNYSNIMRGVAKKISENIELICQIEFAMRGILPSCTKSEIKYILECFSYYTRFDPQKNKEEHFYISGRYLEPENEINLSENSPLSQFALDFAADFAIGRAVKFRITSYLFPVMYLIMSYFSELGWNSFTFYVYEISICMFFNSYIESSSMVVFENSDLDSAIDTVLEAAWANIMSPWILKHICVQESVYCLFMTKLKQKMRLTNSNSNVPINYKPGMYTKCAQSMIEEMHNEAVRDGIELIVGENEQLKKIVVLDDAQWFMRYVSDTAPNLPVVCLQAFRTTKEALGLVKKLSSKAVSLWCNNISVCNEFAFAAPVDRVWINTHSHVSPFNSYKLDGTDHKLGHSVIISDSTECNDIDVCNVFDKCIERMTKISQSWQASSSDSKVAAFKKIASNLLLDEKKMFSKQPTEAIKYLDKAAYQLQRMKNGSFHVEKNVLCMENYSSRGIILITIAFDNNLERLINAIVAVTMFGNGAVILSDNPFIIDTCSWLSTLGLPIDSGSEKSFRECFLHIANMDDLKGHWILMDKSDNFPKNYVPLNWYDDIADLEKIALCWDVLRIRFTKCKTIWNKFGESFST